MLQNDWEGHQMKNFKLDLRKKKKVIFQLQYMSKASQYDHLSMVSMSMVHGLIHGTVWISTCQRMLRDFPAKERWKMEMECSRQRHWQTERGGQILEEGWASSAEMCNRVQSLYNSSALESVFFVCVTHRNVQTHSSTLLCLSPEHFHFIM